jgi:Restriction endonuclease
MGCPRLASRLKRVTRPSVDGGRDVIGAYRVGPLADRIALDFALEAKCYSPGNGVGVKELSRLISRLRHRQFGILVTTSFLGHQAYQELHSDRHPVVVITGTDVAAILVKSGMGTPEVVREWLTAEFPTQATVA